MFLISQYTSGISESAIFLLTFLEVTLILSFGQVSIATRYKSRVLAFMMISLSYSISLLMRAGLEDLCFIQDSDCEKLSVSLRVLRVFLIICFLSHTMIAYYNRDSMLTAHNYHYSKNFSRIELVAEAESEEQDKNFYILHSFPLCDNCSEQFVCYKSMKLVCIHQNCCSACFDLMTNEQVVQVIDDWVETVMSVKQGIN